MRQAVSAILAPYWNFRGVAALGFTVAVIAGLAWALLTQPQWRAFRWAHFWRQFGDARWGWIAVGVGVVYSSYWIRAERWRVMLRPIKRNPSRLLLTASNFVGFAAIAIFGRPAEAVRPWLVARGEDVPIAGQFAVLFVERLLDTIALTVITGTAVALVAEADPIRAAGLSSWLATAGWAVTAAGAAALFVLFVLPRAVQPFIQRWTRVDEKHAGGWLRKTAGVAEQFSEGLQGLTNHRDAAECFLWTALEWAVLSVTYWCVLAGCLGGRWLAFDELLLFIGLVSLGSAIQIPGVGGGLQITTIWILDSMLHVPPEEAAGAGVLMWLVVLVSAIPGAAAVFLVPSVRRVVLRGGRRLG